MQTKICKKCKIEQPIENFSNNNRNKDKLYAWCKLCAKNHIPKTYILVKNKVCSICKQELSSYNFAQNKQHTDGLLSACTQCRTKIARKKHKTNPSTNLFHQARMRSMRKNLPFDLTLEWLQQRYTGRCELTNIEFEHAEEGKHPYSPSIDRIDSSKGYTKDNVRIIITQLNMAIGKWGVESLIKIVKAIKQ